MARSAAEVPVSDEVSQSENRINTVFYQAFYGKEKGSAGQADPFLLRAIIVVLRVESFVSVNAHLWWPLLGLPDTSGIWRSYKNFSTI
jgi:hypothetical protein